MSRLALADIHLPPARPARRRLGADRRGGVALLTGVAFAPLLLATGIAIDMSRLVQFRAALQSAADAAALAGAAAYTSGATASTAAAVASTYMTNAEPSLPRNLGVTFAVTPATTTGAAGQTTGYTMSVAVSAHVPTTIMALVTPSLAANVSAVALNQVETISANLGNWKSSAWDANTIYWYIVPPGGALPATSDLHMLFTNTAPAPTTLPSIQITAGQSIGFALRNVTGGIHGYGSNQYGSAQGHTNWLYSQLSPPAAQAYPTVATNCALQVVVATTSNPTPVETPGACAATTPANATVSCAQLPGQTAYFFWNDMGGSADDYDYNDAQYSITCPGAASGLSAQSAGPTNVVLIR